MKTNTILSLRYLLALVLACSFACLSAQTREFNFDFSTNDHGWVAGFSDFDETMRSIMELDSGHLPVPGDASKKGLYITGNNRSDDLFMYYKKKVKVQPQQWYRVQMSISFLSSVPSGLIGIGGAPAEAVIVKSGAMIDEPISELQSNGIYRMSIDKGNQNSEGADTDNLGHIANSGTFDFELVERDNVDLPSFWVKSDASGTLWLLVGTDSGFEGPTELYYTSIDFVFTPLSLDIHDVGSQLQLSWLAGVLQESDDLKIWSDVDGAASPWLVTPSGSAKFWRVRQ